jgi:hypothetical protein
MLKRSLIIGAISLGFLLTACNPKHSDIVLSKYDTGNVKMGEFEKEYAKSAGSVEKAKQDSISKYKDFLKLLKLFNALV